MLELLRVLGHRLRERVDLLEDPRHRRHVGRLDLHELGDDLLGVAAEVDDPAADVERGELHGQREGVGERQVQVGQLALVDELDLLDHRPDRGAVPVAEHDALGATGGARGVDDRVRVLGRNRLAAAFELGPVGVPAAFPELVEATFNHDDVLELVQAIADLGDLGRLALVLADHDARVRVAHHPLAFVRRVGRVDRDDYPAGTGDGQARVRPLGAGVAQQAHPLAGLQAHVDQPERDLVDDLADLGKGLVLPRLAVLRPDGHTIREPISRVGRRPRDRPVARLYRSARHRSPLCAFSSDLVNHPDPSRLRSRSALAWASFSRSVSSMGAPIMKSRPSSLRANG